MHETLNFNNCMLPCSYYLLRLTSPSGSWPSSESSHVLMWLLKEGWFLPYILLLAVVGQYLPQTSHWSGITGWAKPTKSCMVKLNICRWRLPPPPPPTRVVLYVEATVCLKPSSLQLSLCRLFRTWGQRVTLVFDFYPASNGSGTSEDLFWKLDALQTFIRDLHWPEEEFGKHLEQRLKLMASDMIESCVKR